MKEGRMVAVGSPSELEAKLGSSSTVSAKVLPEPLRTASRFLPQTYTLRAMRECLLAGKSLGELGPDLVAGAVVLPLAGALIFKLGLSLFEKRGALY
jgi:hypothetical protein